MRDHLTWRGIGVGTPCLVVYSLGGGLLFLPHLNL